MDTQTFFDIYGQLTMTQRIKILTLAILAILTHIQPRRIAPAALLLAALLWLFVAGRVPLDGGLLMLICCAGALAGMIKAA